MAKQRRTLDERIQSCTAKEEEMLEKLKQYQAQRKRLEKQKKAEERKIRTHRLIQIGAAVESVLGRAVTEEDVPKLIAFLKKQESNGKYFSKAMQTERIPDTAKEYLDRQALWESVTKIEKKSNAQFAREVEVALPVEFSRELQLAVIKEYVQTNFISKGMCADIAIHDKGNANPHAHILLTTRPIKADGSWGAKEKKDYARDENGDRIPLIDKKTGKQKLGRRNEKLWKRITVQANDWNNRGNVEKWRKS